MSLDEMLKSAADRLQYALGETLLKEQIKALRFILQGYQVYCAGKPGTGKTTIFKQGNEAGIFPRRIYSLDMKLFSKKPMDEILAEIPMYDGDDIVLDDVGIEGNDKEFGNLKEVLETILRYREIHCPNCLTHITTNLPIKVFAARYGERVQSRMKTYQQIAFVGEDLRRATPIKAAVATSAPLKDDADPIEKWSIKDLVDEIELRKEKIARLRKNGYLPETIERNEKFLARLESELRAENLPRNYRRDVARLQA